jgi:hypothetical protein
MHSFKRLLGLEQQEQDASSTNIKTSYSQYNTFRQSLQTSGDDAVTIALSDRLGDGSFAAKQSPAYETYNTNYNYPLLDATLDVNKVGRDSSSFV